MRTNCRTCAIFQLLSLLLLGYYLPTGVDAQVTRGTRSLVIGVEDFDVFVYLKTLASSPSLYKSKFPYAARTGLSVDFVLLPIDSNQQGVSSAEFIQANLTSLGVAAVISDYYISLAIASYSLDIPYFVIRKKVFSFPPGTPNIFEIEIDNFHLSVALYDVSAVYKWNTLVAVSDGTPASSQFLVNFATRLFSVRQVDEGSSDSDIYNAFSSYDSNSLPSGVAWIMLFDEPNLPLMERTLKQASRAGILVSSQYFFVPSLSDTEHYLVRFYRSDAEFYTFRLVDNNRYTRQELLQPFLLDCINHFLKAFRTWTGTASNVTLSNSIAAEPSILNPLSGSFTYDANSHVRSNVQINVLRSNRSQPPDNVLSLSGRWISDASPPFRPEYNGVDAISRSRITFAAYVAEPYFYDYNSQKGTARGLCIEIVEAMRTRLGFEYRVVATNSQNEVFEMLKNGSADVSLNFMSPTFDRIEYVDLSVDMVQDGIQMLNRKVVHSTDFFHVFQPFSFYVWVSIVVAIILLSATLYACDKISPNTQNKLMYTPFESFFLVMSSFLMSKVETEPKKLSSRLFTLLLWFSTLLYMTTYLSNLVAFLIKPDEQVVFASVGELANTKGFKWGYVKDSLVDRQVKTNWPKVHARAQLEWPDEMYLNNIDEAIAKVLSDPTFILIASADTLSFVKNLDCKLKVMGNIANSHYLTWFFRRGFRFKNDLNEQLKTRKDTDFAQLRSKYFDLNRCYTGQTDIENKVQLGFEYLCGLFALMGIGIVLGFLQLLGRWIIQRVKERRSVRGVQKLHFKLGHEYLAEVLDVKPDGIYFRISGENEVRFMNNSDLYPGEDENTKQNSSRLKGKLIQVRYLGKCSVNTKAKIFVRHECNTVCGDLTFTENSGYSQTHSDEESA